MKTTSPARVRLDQHLHEAGHFDSREKAQRAILAGQVTVDGRIADKAGTKVSPMSEILITGRDRYVGRGGHKLEGALSGFAIDPMGLSCLDLGSSTGGFTDCLLQHWASHVTAVDVEEEKLRRLPGGGRRRNGLPARGIRRGVHWGIFQERSAASSAGSSISPLNLCSSGSRPKWSETSSWTFRISPSVRGGHSGVAANSLICSSL